MCRVSNIVLTEAGKLRDGWPIIAAGRQIGTKQSSQRQLQVLGLSPEVDSIYISWKIVLTGNAVADAQGNCSLPAALLHVKVSEVQRLSLHAELSSRIHSSKMESCTGSGHICAANPGLSLAAQCSRELRCVVERALGGNWQRLERFMMPLGPEFQPKNTCLTHPGCCAGSGHICAATPGPGFAA